MVEIKFWGRGGQGVVVASQILARAFFKMGMYPQCFSLFGGERRGAPVEGFLRVNEGKIFLKCGIRRPDHLILMSPDLMDEGLEAPVKPGGLILINTPLGVEEFSDLRGFRLALVDAQSIAEGVGLGRTINTAVLGAYCRASGLLPISCLEEALREAVPAKVEANLAAARRAYEATEVFLPSEG